jgi:DNA-binding SARP family transcriptional activator/predicted ATPase
VESRLALYLLGPPRIERDGAPIKVNRRKAIALVVYLAVTGERQRRDTLVNLLWPEYDGPRGRAALRRTLYALKKALDGGWLEVDREVIGLSPGAGPSTGSGQSLWVDVVQFRRHLAECETHGYATSQACSACVTPLSEAVALVRGDFLSGFGLRDSFNFDDWQMLQAESLRRELSGALERLVGWHSAQHEFEPALVYARRRLGLDPLDEGTHRQLMRLYAWSGRRPAALRQYEECVAVLDEQLGVPPQEATRELFQAIQVGRVHPPPEEGGEQIEVSFAARGLEVRGGAPSFLEGEVAVDRPLFVARERELAQLGAFLDRALAGQGRVVFVTGEAGSGKTALVEEFALRAQEAHAELLVANGNCNAHTGVGDPYLPFREILELLTGDVEARWAAGAMTREQARRLWKTLPLTAQALVEGGRDLVDTFVPGPGLVKRAAACTPGGTDWLARLAELVERKVAAPVAPSMQQSDLFEQYTRVLQTLAQRGPLLLSVDDLQWADLGSINLLFHLGRQLAGSRILIVGAFRPEEVAIGRGGERHPLEPVVNEFQRDFGQMTLKLGRAESREFVDALLDGEPNRLGDGFREMLYRQTHGHPLFTVELLRGMQERGDLIQDSDGRWVEGPALDWRTLPARVEAVVAERIGRLPQRWRDLLSIASVEGETFTAEVVARVQASSERETVRCLSKTLDRQHRLVSAQGIRRLGGQRLSRYRFRHILYQRYLYSTLDQVERVYQHEQVGFALEELYKDQEIAAVAVQLARHFEEARITEKAIYYLHQAGERAVQLSAYQEAIPLLTRGLALLEELPDSGDAERRSERAEQELGLQLSLGTAWIGSSSPAPEWRKVFSRARELCQQMGKTSELCRVLGELSLFYYVRAEHRRARELAEEALSVAERAKDPLLVALGHWFAGLVLFGLGEYAAARAHLEQTISFYDPRQHHRYLVSLRGSDFGLSALAYAACCLWCLGYPEQALSRSQEALALARELGHPFSLADVLCYAGCLFDSMRRDVQGLKETAEELMQLSKAKDFASWLAAGTFYRAQALIMLGQVQEGMEQMREGIAAHRSTGARLYVSRILGALAEAQAKAGQPKEGLATLAEALALVEETGERHWEAELYQVRAELLLMQGDDAGAEASLHEAIEVARRQQAKLWELRAATGLPRLWHKQGRMDEARQLLEQTYGWFTEGFDTPDLVEARELLEVLSRELDAPVLDGHS